MHICQDISSCKECLFCTNSSQLHNDPFTSTPLPLVWYCEKGEVLRHIEDPSVIDPGCPIKDDLDSRAAIRDIERLLCENFPNAMLGNFPLQTAKFATSDYRRAIERISELETMLERAKDRIDSSNDNDDGSEIPFIEEIESLLKK